MGVIHEPGAIGVPSAPGDLPDGAVQGPTAGPGGT